MNELLMLEKDQQTKTLEDVFEKRVPLSISYQTEDRWVVLRGLLTRIVNDDLFAVRFTPLKKSHNIDLIEGDSVGVTFKFGINEDSNHYVFDSTIEYIRRGHDSPRIAEVVLAKPEQIEVVQRRSYNRVDVPQGVTVDVNLWHKDENAGDGKPYIAHVSQSWIGELKNVSALGMQIEVNLAQGPDFKEGQFIGLQFRPLPDETTIAMNAYIRAVVESENDKCVMLGLEIVGLEASPEGRLVLQRICSTVGRYLEMNGQVVV